MAKPLTIGIIVFDGVLTGELMGAAEVFALASTKAGFKGGANIILIGVEPQPNIRTEEGIRIAVDATIADDLALDVLFVPGGNDVDPLLAHAALNAFIRKHEQTAEWVGSMCAGAFVLGGAGVLDGKQATTWFGGEDDLQTQFPAVHVIHDRPVVVDQRRITANGGLVSYRAALILLGKLSSTEIARSVYESLNMGRLGTWADIETSIATGN